METFSALLAICAGNSPVIGEFLAQRPVTWSFDVFFDLRLNEWLSKQSWGWWFETPTRPLWRHSNVTDKIPPGSWYWKGNSVIVTNFSSLIVPKSVISTICSAVSDDNFNEQSGTKPNLVATILVFFFLLYVMFLRHVQCGSNNDLIKYCGWGHNCLKYERQRVHHTTGYKIPLEIVCSRRLQ